MKKGLFILALVFGVFLCVIIGVFIGRNTLDNYFTVNDRPNSRGDSFTEAPSASAGKININTATAEQLCQLPGIGERLSANIIAYRDANGHYSSIDQLIMVDGIGEERLDAIREFITTGG